MYLKLKTQSMNSKYLVLLILLQSLLFAKANSTKIISVEELHDKIAGAWIGQMIGNIYGLPKVDYFGYGWKTEKNINMIALHTGCMEEFGGWWSSLNIQYQDDNGKWIAIQKVTSTPALPTTDIVFFQPHFVEYVFEFEPVKTKAIRIIGDTKVENHWHKYTKKVSSFTSITELSIYEK